jgi:hypothetical protein
MAVDNWNAQIDNTKWTQYKACSCGGVYRVKYRSTTKPQLELHILPNRNRFSILDGTRQIAGDVLTNLQQVLQTIE